MLDNFSCISSSFLDGFSIVIESSLLAGLVEITRYNYK